MLAQWFAPDTFSELSAVIAAKWKVGLVLNLNAQFGYHINSNRLKAMTAIPRIRP